MHRPWIALRAGVLALILLLPRATVAASLTVAWDPVDGAAGFVVYYGTSSGAYTGSVDAGSATQKQIDSLADGTPYYFAVRAYDASGLLGLPSIEVSGTTSGTAGPLAILCPAPSGTSSNGSPMALSFSPTVSGGVAPIASSCTPSSGSLFPVGATALTCTATDASGTTVSCQSAAIVAVTPTPPAAIGITCPVIAPVVSHSGNPVRVDFSPTVIGGVAPITTMCTPSSGTLYPVGTTGVTCSAYDSRGQSNSCTTSVTVTTDKATTPVPTGVPTEFDAQVSNVAGRCPDTTFAAINTSLAPQTFAVVATSATNYSRGSCSALPNAKSVHVQGVAQPDGRVVATTITFLR